VFYLRYDYLLSELSLRGKEGLAIRGDSMLRLGKEVIMQAIIIGHSYSLVLLYASVKTPCITTPQIKYLIKRNN